MVTVLFIVNQQSLFFSVGYKNLQVIDKLKYAKYGQQSVTQHKCYRQIRLPILKTV